MSERPVLSAREDALAREVVGLIEDARAYIATDAQSELVMHCWNVGKRIRMDMADAGGSEMERAALERLSEYLEQRYGVTYSRPNLCRMVEFADLYPHEAIVAPLARQVTWPKMCEILSIADQCRRDFYLTRAAQEQWSEHVLRESIAEMLYERTLAARGLSTTADERDQLLGTEPQEELKAALRRV